MESQTDQENPLTNVVDTLVGMFGDVLSRDAIFAVVESCEGDLSLAAEAIMNITSDTSSEQPKQATVVHCSSPIIVNTPPIVETSLVKLCLPQEIKHNTYASASQIPSRGAIPKQTPYAPKPPPFEWSDDIKRIFTYHNQGSRILVIMRGIPGSGKSYLARQIVNSTIGSSFVDYNTHIYSTDDYFMVRGSYQYDKSRLRDAHEWNKHRFGNALRQGVSPLILDNTNIEAWEMEPYVRMGVDNGYYIELVEPTTSWAKKANVLFSKNIHNVPLITIRRMLDNYQDNITVEDLFKKYNLSYPPDKTPPVLRLIPPVIEQPQTKENNVKVETAFQSGYFKRGNEFYQDLDFKYKSDDQKKFLPQIESTSNIITEEVMVHDKEVFTKQDKYKEVAKKLEEFEKVERQWEDGDSWDDNKSESLVTPPENAQAVDPKPPRNYKSKEKCSTASGLENVQSCTDWTELSMFMPSWYQDTTQKSITQIPETKVETVSSSTCIERFDTDLDNPNRVVKVLSATPKDINLYYIPPTNEKIPNKRMLDKSTLTNEQTIMDAFRCENEEQHFIAFRKLFKNIPRAYLRDIFDKCHGDVNWAVSIVLEDNVSTELTTQEEDFSDEDEKTESQCSCLAAYNIVPNTSHTVSSVPANQTNMSETPVEPLISGASGTPSQKLKNTASDTRVQLKHEIEKNFVISDEYYSEHCLKIRKLKHGITNPVISTTPPVDDVVGAQAIAETETRVPKVITSDDEESVSSTEDPERTVNINLGPNFLVELDHLFGRCGMTYSSSIVPRINIPISMLNEINALWMESLMHQLEILDKQKAKMLEEDAEFARQLESKEAELAKAGKEPEIPDFKEIMDMDLALSLYHKDVAEWRDKELTDIAAKMTRDKLYNLFPDMSPDILSELFMAHNNNFRDTVEVLLVSTGRANIIDEKNGLNKFIMEKEMERQEKLMAEEKKALSAVEWPLLPKGEKVDMSVVYGFREKADKHLGSRNENLQKAQEYMRRGMTQVANYYNGIASFHKNQYEQANSMAAVSLVQYHASNFPNNATIDLHYLRVSEAKETLDLFLDTHIQKLRDPQNKAVKYHTLFFITGRGLHSAGKPRVKPAVKSRLKERGIQSTERNPGLLTAKVYAEDKMTHEV